MISQAKILTTFLSVLLVTVTTHLFSQTTSYVTFDATCMERFLYEDVSASNNQIYHDYHIPLSETEITIIRTKKVNSYKKSDYDISNTAITSCESINKNQFQSMVGKVSTGEKGVYFVEETEEFFNVYQGLKASYLTSYDQYFFLHERGLSFKVDYFKTYDIIEEITVERKKGKVLYTGKSATGCTDKFYLLQIPAECCGQTEIEFVKNVGITREVSDNSDLELRSINDVAIADYLNWQCNGFEKVMETEDGAIAIKGGGSQGGNIAKSGKKTTETTAVVKKDTKTASTTTKPLAGKKIGGTTVEFAYSGSKKITQPEPKTTSTVVPQELPDEFQTKGSSNNNIHLVDIGDTLFSLARKYKTTVSKLKELNNLEANEIYVAQLLKVPATVKVDTVSEVDLEF